MTMTWEWCKVSVALASTASCVREVPSMSWSEVLEPGYLLPGLRGQLASVNSGVCPQGPWWATLLYRLFYQELWSRTVLEATH